MKASIGFLCLLAMANATQVTPVQKVVTLLQGMLEKAKKEKHTEQVVYSSSRQFCTDESDFKMRAIKDEKLTVEGLEALINKDTADIAHLLKLISLLEKDKDVWSHDIKAATKVRDIEKADYDNTHKDYSESISAIQRAVAVLQKQSGDRKQASFAQISSLKSLSLIPEAAKKTMDIFLQEGENDAADSLAPEANGYEFQSNGVVEMLQKLLSKFIDERTALEKEEANSKHAYQMLMADLHAQIKQAVKERYADQLSKNKRLKSKADELADKKATLKLEYDDEKYLKDLQAACEMQGTDFQNRQQLRAEEINAIEKAIEIISSGAVAGNAEKHLPSLLQKQGTSFGQLRNSNNLNTKMQLQQRVSLFLHSKAGTLNSRVLATVASRASAGPFGKVKKMIKDLVVRLMEEANEEADHKGWCDTELSTNEQTRKEKTEAVETLNADIDSLTASIAKLTETKSEITKEIAELDSAMAKATELRTEQKAKNTETIADAQEAQTAVAQALTVLNEFYAKAGEATSFAQLEPYKGMQAENGGVIGMLEVIESDFARLESETKASEATLQKTYDGFMSDSKVDKAEKSTAVEHKTAKIQDESQDLTVNKKDLDGTQSELEAALAYFDKLKPSCVDSGVSYEDRVARRKEEIESLQQSLQIMNGEDIA